MNTGKIKKNRSVNFTVREKELLINLVAKYKGIIENKRTDGTSVAEKHEVWKKIQYEFNTHAPNLCFRSAESLKKLYENNKKDLRKKIGEHKKMIYLTGGGPPPVLDTEKTDDLLLDIVSDKTMFGLQNPCDSDSLNNAAIPQEQTNSQSTPQSSAVTLNDNIEIVFDDLSPMIENHNPLDIQAQSQKSSMRNQTSGVLEETKSTPVSHKTQRRRPHTSTNTLLASNLYDKYESLVDKKLVNEDFIKRKTAIELECFQREHEKRMVLLELDIEIKKKQLGALKRTS